MKLGVRNAAGTDGFEYVGSLVYRRTPSGLELESAAFDGGRIIASQGTTTTYTPNYFLTDHLGSTRVVVDGQSGDVVERNNYYPYGARWMEANNQISNNRIRFTGYEDQTMLDRKYMDAGARFYDPIVTRMLQTDPLAGIRPEESLYLYCGGNPISRIDPTGMIWDTTEDEEIANRMLLALSSRIGELSSMEQSINNKIEKIEGNSKLSDEQKNIRIEKHESTLNEISLEKDNLTDLKAGINEISASESVFTFNTVEKDAFVTTNSQGVTILNNYGTLGSRIHETTHGVQIVRGLINVDSKGDILPGSKIQSRGALEIPAYQNEFSISKTGPHSTVGGTPQSIRDITLPWLIGLKNSEGVYKYR